MGDYYYVDSAFVTNPLISSHGVESGLSGGVSASSGSWGSTVPWQAIGEAIGSIISGSAQASATQKMARLQEAIGDERVEMDGGE